MLTSVTVKAASLVIAGAVAFTPLNDVIFDAQKIIKREREGVRTEYINGVPTQVPYKEKEKITVIDKPDTPPPAYNQPPAQKTPKKYYNPSYKPQEEHGIAYKTWDLTKSIGTGVWKGSKSIYYWIKGGRL